MHVTKTGIDISGDHPVISGNIIVNLQWIAIWIRNAVGARIEGNIVDDTDGVYVDSTATDILVRDNLLMSGRRGIRVDGATNTEIRRNTITEMEGDGTAASTGAGVRIYSSSANTVVTDNVITFNE